MSAIPDPLSAVPSPTPDRSQGGSFVLVPLQQLRPVAVWMLLASGLISLVAFALWPGPVGLMLFSVGSALGIVAIASMMSVRRGQGPANDVLAQALRGDPDTLILTDGSGIAEPWGGVAADAQALQNQLAGWCADPDQIIQSLLAETRQTGWARRDFQRGASGFRLSVHVLGSTGACDLSGERLLWRFTRADRAANRGLDALGLPVLTLSASGEHLSANSALIRLLDAPEQLVRAGSVREGVSGPGSGEKSGASLAQPLAPLMAQLRPALEKGESHLTVRMPGGQCLCAQVVPARDGQFDILFLPTTAMTDGLAATPGPQDFEDIPVALVQLDPEGRIYGTNRAARSLMALSAAEDRFLWEVVEGLGRPVADWLQDARAGRALNRPEVLRVTCAGGETFVQIILRRASPSAPPGMLVAVVSDATELKSLEARFVQSQKMQAIGQLAGGIAHDFNNLLTAISGHCDLLLMGLDPYDPDYNDLQQIHQNANRAAALVRQLLAFSRKQTLQPEILSVDDLLEDVVHLLTRLVGERIQLRLTHDPLVGRIRADRRQLEQVIVNLVVNARDAMPMGGEIRIECQTVTLEAETTIGRARLPAGQYARLQVIDTGVGIPTDLIEKIFEPFFTTKRPGEGTGLGLSTAYGIVKQMGGYIFVESLEGSGTTFSLYFATDTSAAPEPATSRGSSGATTTASSVRTLQKTTATRPGAGPALVVRDSSSPPVQGRTPAPRARQPESLSPATDIAGIVLLVEDEAPVRAFAARALRLQGYRVLEAEDGEQALEVLNDPALAVDIFVSDVVMPGRGGPAWVAEALQSRPGTPVVFISGYIEDTLTEALGRTPHAVFLEKPFSLDALCRTIALQLDQVQG